MGSKIYLATDSSPVDIQSYELCSDMIDVVLDMSMIYSGPTSSKSLSTMDALAPSESFAIIRLNNGMVLYLREVNM